VTSTNSRVRKLIAAGAFAVAAVAAPFAASAVSTTDSSAVALPPGCLAWFGNQETGKCLGYSQGNGISAGTPGVGFNGSEGGGFGVNTGPMLPGSTINRGIN
jgi:hypothetical protein